MVRGGYADAVSMQVPVLKSHTYLSYLERRTRANGVVFVRRTVESFVGGGRVSRCQR